MPKKGHKQTEEHKRKISESRKGIKFSEKHRENLRKSHLGYIMPTNQKEKISLAMEGKNTWQKDRIQPEETKRKISEGMKGKNTWVKGENNPNWKGGKSIKYPSDWTETLKESIRIRDNYTCQLCGINQDELSGWCKQLDIHHIDYDKDNLNPKNLIALCRRCHQKTSFNRNKWIKHFQLKSINELNFLRC